MRSRLYLVAILALTSLVSACASTEGDGGKERGAYGSIGIGRHY